MPSALEIARYLLSKAAGEPDEPELMTHLRLQKLVYYVQAWSLAYNSGPMFQERIEAWDHGPVVRSVYDVFKRYQHSAIPESEADEGAGLESGTRSMVDWVWESYKKYSATQLRTLTHTEDPWRLARGSDAARLGNVEITRASMFEYFTRKRKEFERLTGVTAERLAEAEAARKEGRWISLKDLGRRLGYVV